MKNMKRMLAMVLCLVMMLAMSATVFAAEQTDPADPTYVLKINTVNNHTYTIYQLATGDVSSDATGTVLSNVKPGANAKAGTTTEQIEGLKEKSGAGLGEAAYALVDTDAPFAYTSADGTVSDGKVVGDGTEVSVTLPGGYYVITDDYTDKTNVADGDSISRYMVSLVKDTTVTPKTITVTPDKDIVEDGELKEENEASIGDEVTYRLSGTIPDMEGYNGFKYVFVDTLSKGLTPNVSKGDTFTGYIADKSGDTFTNIKDDNGEPKDVTVSFVATSVSTDSNGVTTVRFAMENAISYKEYVGKYVYMDYTAVLNREAVIVNDKNENRVKIEFSNDPTKEYQGEPDFGPDEPKGVTAEVTVETYTTKLTVTKKDGTGGILTGAEFELKGTGVNVGYVTGQEFVAVTDSGASVDGKTYYKLADGAFTDVAPTDDTANRYEPKVGDRWPEYKLVAVAKEQYTQAQTSAKAFVNAAGEVEFTGLGAGTYTLTEVTTPDGYNTIDPITFTVSWTKADGFQVAIAEDSKNKTVTITNGTGILAVTVVNEKGTLLPDTGGIGTTIFYVIGGILMVGAGVLLLTRKRAGR